jgi:hypothetical protein
MLGLQVRQVDLVARTIRLDPGTTKNGEGREVVMRLEVEELLRAAVAEMKPKGSVFTREDGKPIKDFRGLGGTYACVLERAAGSTGSVALP